MNIAKLITYSLIRYARYYKLQAIAVVIAVAVIIGSVMVGVSVRHTLASRVSERLLDTETILFARSSFMESDFLQNPLFKGDAKGYLLTNGFVSLNGRLIPVDVWGMDDEELPKGAIRINTTLANELGISTSEAKPHGDLVLRLPATSVVPSGSLFVSENYTTSIRLACQGVVSTEKGGNLSLRNEHTLPLNVFVNRQELGELLELEGKINLLFSKHEVTTEQLNQAWSYSESGLKVTDCDGYKEISTDRVFLQEEVVETIVRTNPSANRHFSYLANSIETLPHTTHSKQETSIPYSFVTAVDYYQDEALKAGEVILSDYSARRLSVKPGDSIALSYFVSADFKTLQTESLHLIVKRIVPLEELYADKRLSADFPGLTSVESCTQWDSDLPIDMSLITDEDERYWERYRATPKALLAYCDVAQSWSNSYGSATAIRITDEMIHLSELTPQMFGLQAISPRGEALYAALNGVDFSSLFLALGFFILISAFLFMALPISEMMIKRKEEFALLASIGFTQKRIKTMLRIEGELIVIASSLLGVLVGLLYTYVIMWLLGTVWKGATHTEGFSVYLHWGSIALATLVSIALSLSTVRIAITQGLKAKLKVSETQAVNLKRKKGIVALALVTTLLLLLFNFLALHSIALFVVAALGVILSAGLLGDYMLCKKGREQGHFQFKTIYWHTLYAHRKQAMLSFLTLTLGVFTVFSVGLNRQGFADSSQLKGGTGGYHLWCESSVPIYHNLSTLEGRERLSLGDLPTDVTFLQCLRYSSDEASCLNLNKVTSPTVLGVDMEALRSSDFQMADALTATHRDELFTQMQQCEGDVYPALVDATVLTWSLGLKLGDSINYQTDQGDSITIRLVGTLENSIFQGQILIDRMHFSSIWPETTGSNLFLARVAHSTQNSASVEAELLRIENIVSQALSEYGVRITTTNQRLKAFYSVTDTYLTIFMTLGGLGLLLGIFCFVVVIRKSLAMRQGEIALLRSLGFTEERIAQLLIRENLIVPLYAVVVAVIASFLGISGGMQYVSFWIYLLAFLFTLLFIAVLLGFTRQSVWNILRTTDSAMFKVQKTKI